MTGIVLCGGKSSRMGSDKGLLQYEFLTWAELAAINLQHFNFLLFCRLTTSNIKLIQNSSVNFHLLRQSVFTC
jgi:molybdopterin-guanine dinucleotide biosynthesis protein A